MENTTWAAEHPDIARRIDSLTADEVDKLPIGVIQLDTSGTILAYNKCEAQLAQLVPEQVIGKNFFTQIAPCTEVKDFAGRFREGVARRKLHTSFRYQFTFKGRNPVDVVIELYYSAVSQTAWVFVRPLPASVAVVP